MNKSSSCLAILALIGLLPLSHQAQFPWNVWLDGPEADTEDEPFSDGFMSRLTKENEKSAVTEESDKGLQTSPARNSKQIGPVAVIASGQGPTRTVNPISSGTRPDRRLETSTISGSETGDHISEGTTSQGFRETDRTTAVTAPVSEDEDAKVASEGDFRRGLANQLPGFSFQEKHTKATPSTPSIPPFAVRVADKHEAIERAERQREREETSPEHEDNETPGEEITEIATEPPHIETEDSEDRDAFDLNSHDRLPVLSSGKSQAKSVEKETSGAVGDMKMLIVALGTVDQEPPNSLKNDHSLYFGQDTDDITNLGKQQAYRFGRWLRNRYRNFIPTSFDKLNMQLLSSNQAASQIRLQALLAGMMPPKEGRVWSNDLNWQPIPYEIDDKILAIDSIECPAMRDVQDAIDEETTDDAMLIKKEHEHLLRYIATQTGLGSSLNTLDVLAQNMEQLKQQGSDLPEWALETNIEGLENDTTVVDKISIFNGVKELLCARHEPCRKLQSGPWLWDIVSTISSGIHNKGPLIKVYSSDSNALLSLLWAFGLEYPRIPEGSALMIEYRSEPEHSIRVSVSELEDIRHPGGERMQIPIKILRCDSWCPLDLFLRKAREQAAPSIEKLCNIEPCMNKEGKVSTRGAEVNLLVKCEREFDQSGDYFCENWAKHNYCTKYISVRDFYCRKTCLCNDEFRSKISKRKHRKA